MLLLPGTPMLFQGQEFGASNPFLYFADHEGELAAAVRKGRADFVRQFPSLASPDAQARLAVPDDPATFERCKLNWNERDLHVTHRRLHEDLIALRRTDEAFRMQKAGAVDGAVLETEAFVMRYATTAADDERLLVINFGHEIVAWRVRGAAGRAASGMPVAGPLVERTHGVRRAAGGARCDARRMAIQGHSATVLAPAHSGERNGSTRAAD
jgi:1,4-alpha-glucan branching enzyme